jgi:hypothetical protein
MLATKKRMSFESGRWQHPTGIAGASVTANSSLSRMERPLPAVATLRVVLIDRRAHKANQRLLRHRGRRQIDRGEATAIRVAVEHAAGAAGR